MKVNWDKAQIGHANYKEQFVEAFWVGGSKDAAKESSWGDVVFHIISMPWKLLFACCPPTDYANGWLCFFGALAFIAVLTAIVGDIAALFGCVVGVLFNLF